jgi:hypothetical protein
MRILLTVSLLVLTPALAAASPAMQPGLYDIAMQMEMKGMPMQMPPMKFQQCLTAKDIDEGKAYTSGDNKDCKITSFKQNGNKVSYEFNCAVEGGRRMVGQSSGTSHASGYDIAMNGRFIPAMEGMSEFSQKLSAKRIGACAK